MSESPAELFIAKHGRRWNAALNKEFSESQQEQLFTQWRGWWARPEQLAPKDDWFVWVLQGGRGSGKTRAASEWVLEQVRASPRSRGAIVGPTPGDARDVMVEGPSGVLNVGPPSEKPVYEPSKRSVIWPNGARATVYSAFDPGHLHGPEHDWAWCDALEVWKLPKSKEMNPWTSLVMGMRLGEKPRVVVSMVPRRTRAVKTVLERNDVIVTRMSTHDNLTNLPDVYVDEIISVYAGTTLGRTFIEGHLIEEVEGALWRQWKIDETRVKDYPELRSVYVGVDPPGGVTECGIVTAGADEYEQIFILDDASLQAHPTEWGRAAVLQYVKWSADAIVVEKNFGGDMCKSNIEQCAKEMLRSGEIDLIPRIEEAHASRGKYIRAEPYAAIYEQGHGHHVGTFELLEAEMTSFVPGEPSPNRLDAMVWAVSKCAKTRSRVVAGWV